MSSLKLQIGGLQLQLTSAADRAADLTLKASGYHYMEDARAEVIACQDCSTQHLLSPRQLLQCAASLLKSAVHDNHNMSGKQTFQAFYVPKLVLAVLWSAYPFVFWPAVAFALLK